MKTKRLMLSNAGCPKCRRIVPVQIIRAGRTIGETEGWVETKCGRCGTVERVVPLSPEKEGATA